MRKLALILLITSFFATSFAQVPDSDVAKKNSNNLVEEEKPLDEKEEFDIAIAQSLASERIIALKKFLEDFPESERRIRVLEAIVGSRAELADEKLRLNEIDEGISLFKLAVEEAPTIISDRFFTGLLVKFPANLFFRGQRVAANEVAKLIEDRVSDNPKRLLGLATFYLSTENASEALRLANKSVDLDPVSSVAFHTIGYAHRLNFDLDESAKAFEKALEIDPDSVVSKNSLAEMKRATGKPDEAVALYREILETDSANGQAQTGLALSLFESNRKEDAEAEMSKSLERNPKNLAMLVGAAYWYAANENGKKAVELAQQALAFEPRYTWTYIAMARGFMEQNDPLSAERTLLAARRYGNFPTLEYELATSRAAAGFYRDALEGLRNSFSIEDGILKTKLGGRVEKEADQFIDLLSLERRASIFQSKPADTAENSRILKHLLEFTQNLESETPVEGAIESSVDEFISGEDNMKFHRQLYAANKLLGENKALPKVLEITKDAVSGVDDGLNVASPSAAVLSEQLYESRKLAVAGGRTVIVPEIPRATLLNIMRGRIEEISGWALFQQKKPEAAKSRLKLATSVLPRNSAWSRSTSWKLGTILEGEGKSEEALDAYITGYFAADQNTAKKIVVESLYAEVNGSLDGLEERLKKKPSSTDSLSIFTGKPQKEETKTEPEKSNDSTVPGESPDNNGNTILDPTNVPSRVPVAKSTPAEKPIVVETPTDAGNDEKIADKTDLDKVAESDIPKKPALKIPSEAEKIDKPEVGKNEVKIESNILEPDTNITKLTNIPLDSVEKKPVVKRAESSTDAAKEAPIFDPVIIKIPEMAKEDTSTKADNQPKKSADEEEKPAVDDVKKDAVDETKKPIEDDSQKNVDDSSEKTDSNDEKIESGSERPRIVPEKDLAKTDKSEAEKKPCLIMISQDVVTIINGGGSIGVLVGIEEGKGDPKKITAISSSAEDIEVVLEPEIGALAGRAFFVIKSISNIQGLFSVTFDTPCGMKEIPVKVR